MKRLSVNSFSTVFQIAVIILLFNYPVPTANKSINAAPAGNKINVSKPTVEEMRNNGSNLPAATPSVNLQQGPILSLYSDFQNTSLK